VNGTGPVRQNVAVPYLVPECKITFNPETGYYGYTFNFAGRRLHYQLEKCDSLQSALGSVDPHKEMVWEEPRKMRLKG